MFFVAGGRKWSDQEVGVTKVWPVASCDNGNHLHDVQSGEYQKYTM